MEQSPTLFHLIDSFFLCDREYGYLLYLSSPCLFFLLLGRMTWMKADLHSLQMPTQNFGVSWSTKPPSRRALHCGRQRVFKLVTFQVCKRNHKRFLSSAFLWSCLLHCTTWFLLLLLWMKSSSLNSN